MIRTGILGYSDGNGHPFSFSAIVNGYDDEGFAAAGWPVIHNYLKAQGRDRFGIGDARVTCAWTQDPELTARLCAACRIDTACATPQDMIGKVDAVIVARDDWETHAQLAMPFLDAGLAGIDLLAAPDQANHRTPVRVSVHDAEQKLRLGH